MAILVISFLMTLPESVYSTLRANENVFIGKTFKKCNVKRI